MTSTALYRYFNAEGGLLYVGIAVDPDARERQHAQTAKDTWYPLAAKKRVEWFDSRPEAEAAEKVAIVSECPAWNGRHAATMPVNLEGREPPKINRDPAAIEDRRILLRRWERFKSEMRWSGLSAPELVTSRIRKAIASGQFPIGERIPTTTDLARRYGCSAGSVAAGLKPLKEEGVLRSAPGRGTFVEHAG